MRNLFLVIGSISIAWCSAGQTAYNFTTVKDNAREPVEDQGATGTCWSFATVSFLESEIIRKGNSPVDLSEMVNVRYLYPLKADSYIRYQGKQQFGPGGLGHDVIRVLADYGIVPERVYSGFETGKTRYDHGKLDAQVESQVKDILQKKTYQHQSNWLLSVDSVIGQQLPPLPTSFEYNGKKYTPAGFRDAMQLHADDYVSITSFTHHPFYQPFVLEVPDNWAKGSFYNLPLDEMIQVIDHAIESGFTVAWDADVSEKGFSFQHGLAVVPADTIKQRFFTSPVAEKEITQEIRQQGFDTQETTDDHLMHITGMAKDQNGKTYYMTKNSWGTKNPYQGYQYVSKPYLAYKTISIVVHKDAIPTFIRQKLNI